MLLRWRSSECGEATEQGVFTTFLLRRTSSLTSSCATIDRRRKLRAILNSVFDAASSLRVSDPGSTRLNTSYLDAVLSTMFTGSFSSDGWLSPLPGLVLEAGGEEEEPSATFL